MRWRCADYESGGLVVRRRGLLIEKEVLGHLGRKVGDWLIEERKGKEGCR